MSQGVDVRAATIEDIPSVITLAVRVWRAHYAAILSAAQIEYMLERGYAPEVLAAFIHGERSGIDLAIEGPAITGFCAWLMQEGTQLKLDKLYVEPGRQRRGIGAALIDAACGHARARAAQRVVLNVNKRNAQAIAAYRKHGFRMRDSVVIDIGSGFVMDDYVMERTV